MPVSSASDRIFKAEDPVMQTDLELLAKVNTYQEAKFDQGEKNLQDEVNNWSLLRNVAKPQDRDYINGKLNNLVSKINNLGGVDLSDQNNVNQLKNLGYSMYGDDKVMSPVLTTQKMQQLAKDSAAKLNGKNGKDYDSVNAEFLQSKYNDWLNDGQQGTGFDGPTSLPQGSFDNYSNKINEGIQKLKPDMNESPVDDKDAALNYYQVGDKFIKKDRIKAFIDANTSEQDRNILSAHSWKSMQGLSDNNILDLQRRDYDSNIKTLQENRNYLMHQMALTTDFKQKQLFQSQINELHDDDKKTGAIDDLNKQKESLPQLQDGQQLPKQTRQALSDSLFYGAYKEQIASAESYEQKKVELKTNTAAVDKVKMAQLDYWHGKDYDFKVKEFDLKTQEFDLKKQAEAFKEESSFLKFYGMSSGAGGGFYGTGGGPGSKAPLGLMPVKGEDDATKLDNNVITQADANFTASANKFYTNGYNYLMSKDSTIYGKWLKQDSDGNWVPKDVNGPATKIVNSALQSAADMYGNVANMSVKERNGLTFSDDDNTFFQNYKELQEAGLYKTQIANLTSDVFRKAGKEDPTTKSVTIPGVGSVTYAKLKEMVDKKDPLLDSWRNQQPQVKSPLLLGKNAKLPGGNALNYLDAAINTVNDYYNDSAVKKAWDETSKTINPYSRTVSLPKLKNGKLPDEPAKLLVDNITDEKIKKDVDIDDVDLTKVWPKVDLKSGKTSYMGTIRYRKAQRGKDTKGDAGDKYADVDLTNTVEEQEKAGGGWLSNLFGKDNTSVVMGFSLQNEGKTPFDSKNNFQGALQTTSNGSITHKYQIVAVKDPATHGITGYKVFVAIPLGKGDAGVPKFQVMPVPNFLNDASGKTMTFGSNFEGVQEYMNSAFRDTQTAKDFYTRLGIPWNQ